MINIYKSCLGELYTSYDEIDFEDLYCEQCGDYDELVCCFSEEELKDSVKVFIDLQGQLGWGKAVMDEIFELMVSDLEIPIEQIEKDFKNFIAEIKESYSC